ncbi:hypothetical protein G6M89_13615 [Natronolimnobius sp. AArcel1]|uniref:hypothetical protein n=1 Tax=Natronolimnobius sp. AArcel1 TaxID=1679093 RepID=UPI0013E9AE74|nr:hypothetical protein [Natronolimnobius sp. AArcel1]NGM70029.1 hypothetical protein [Natronolimnobius sp. AArcel1]
MARLLTRLEATLPRVIGLLATVVGLCCVLVYPLALPIVYPLVPSALVPGNNLALFGPTHPLVVHFSAIVGPILLTWGLFAVRYRTRAPMTVRRAVLAPLLSLFSLGGGVAVFTYTWARGMPVGWCAAEPQTQFSVSQIMHVEVAIAHFAALSAVSMVVVGAVAARHELRIALASVVVPAVIVVFGFVWQSSVPPLLEFALLVVFASIPFAIGYVTTRTAS